MAVERDAGLLRLVKADPARVQQAQDTLQRWLATGDVRSAPLGREWEDILKAGTWRKVLARTRRAQQLRQASPLVTTLPPEIRQAILQQVGELKKGIAIGDELGDAPEGQP